MHDWLPGVSLYVPLLQGTQPDSAPASSHVYPIWQLQLPTWKDPGCDVMYAGHGVGSCAPSFKNPVQKWSAGQMAQILCAGSSEPAMDSWYRQ